MTSVARVSRIPNGHHLFPLRTRAEWLWSIAAEHLPCESVLCQATEQPYVTRACCGQLLRGRCRVVAAVAKKTRRSEWEKQWVKVRGGSSFSIFVGWRRDVVARALTTTSIFSRSWIQHPTSPLLSRLISLHPGLRQGTIKTVCRGEENVGGFVGQWSPGGVEDGRKCAPLSPHTTTPPPPPPKGSIAR